MAKILSIQERIKLFKEINRVHKEIYGWKMIYNNTHRAWTIDIDGNSRTISVSNGWIQMGMDEAKDFFFHDINSRDITLLRGLFAWEARYFNHVNPYKFHEYDIKQEDLISDSIGKRIKPDIDHPIRCSESLIEVHQRKADGKIWISTNWLYRPECYGSASYIADELLPAMTKIAEGDEKLANRIREKYWQARELNKDEIMMLLERYFRGDRLRGIHWEGGYAFAASRTWKIKNSEQFNEALKVEDKHFQKVLGQYIRWLRSKVIKMPEDDEMALKKIISENYYSFPRRLAINLSNELVEEDKDNPSDVYLWWGGEPNKDANYALLTLFFEIDAEDIGTSRFDEKVSRNLRTLINISEKDLVLRSYGEYEPQVWRAIFS